MDIWSARRLDHRCGIELRDNQQAYATDVPCSDCGGVLIQKQREAVARDADHAGRSLRIRCARGWTRAIPMATATGERAGRTRIFKEVSLPRILGRQRGDVPSRTKAKGGHPLPPEHPPLNLPLPHFPFPMGINPDLSVATRRPGCSAAHPPAAECAPDHGRREDLSPQSRHQSVPLQSGSSAIWRHESSQILRGERFVVDSPTIFKLQHTDNAERVDDGDLSVERSPNRVVRLARNEASTESPPLTPNGPPSRHWTGRSGFRSSATTARPARRGVPPGAPPPPCSPRTPRAAFPPSSGARRSLPAAPRPSPRTGTGTCRCRPGSGAR